MAREGFEALAGLFTDRDNPPKAMGREQIAEVINFESSPRKITIKMLGFNISKNISISQHLLKDYEREYTINGDIDYIQLTLTENKVMGVILPPALPYVPNPTPPAPWSIQGATGSTMKGSGTYGASGTIKWSKDSLSAGDFVKVLISEDEKRFLILDRFESWE